MLQRSEFTTGQVMGITQTSPATLYRYIKDFGDFFSESAKRPKRGKRWTVTDVNIIYNIRQLYFHHADFETIRQALNNNGAMIPAPYDLEKVTELAGLSIQYGEQTQEAAKQAQALAQRVQGEQEWLNGHLKSIWSEQKRIYKEMEDLKREMLRLQWVVRHPVNFPSQKRRRAFRIWQDFRTWVFTEWEQNWKKIGYEGPEE